MKKPFRKPKNNKEVLAKFDIMGRSMCPSCEEYLSPYLWVKGDGEDNIFKCICKKVVRVKYPKNKKAKT